MNFLYGSFYYLRKKYFLEAQKLCLEGLQSVDEDFLRFWSAYSDYKLGDKTKSVKQIKFLEDK